MVRIANEPRVPPEPARTTAPALSPSVRRHLGKSLRGFYAPLLAEPIAGPVSERLEALLAKLERPAN